tara:strand:+ start:670 stop:846 length:177 start_codon:yes stop_codon:yes gene_type:complete
MIKNFKNHLLTYLFSDWMTNEKDVSKIISLKDTLQTQQNELTGHKPIIGFSQSRNKIN